MVLALLGALAPVATALADGEAGLVIHWGDGRVSTHCVAFDGESLTGDELLASAGYDLNQFSGQVCAIGGVGCQHSGSFDSCACQCRSGGDDCTYWGFFHQPYGRTWFYSALGAFSARAEDGDLHGWKWGAGGPASAPLPPATTFEAVCGHPPSAVSTVPPPATRTPPPAGTPPPPPATSTAPSPTVPSAPSAASTAPAPTTATGAVPTVTTGQATIPLGTPAPPTAGDDESGGGSPAGLVAFIVVAAGLTIATGSAIAWRMRHGH
jgi:hypothetical protein